MYCYSIAKISTSWQKRFSAKPRQRHARAVPLLAPHSTPSFFTTTTMSTSASIGKISNRSVSYLFLMPLLLTLSLSSSKRHLGNMYIACGRPSEMGAIPLNNITLKSNPVFVDPAFQSNGMLHTTPSETLRTLPERQSTMKRRKKAP